MRKVAEKSITNSEQRLQTFVELSTEWYWEQDEHFQFRRFSEGLSELPGKSSESHYGKTEWYLSLPESETDDWSDHQALLVRQESFRNYEHRRLDENGDEIWLLASGDPIFDTNGKFSGYSGISRNISEQKRSVATLKKSEEREERLRLPINMAGIGLWEWDMISDHVVWDKKQFKLFGLPEVEGTILLSNVTDVIHPDDREQLNKSAQRVLEEGATAAEEFRIIFSDGSIRWLLGTTGVVQYNDTKTSARLVGVNMDITASKQTEIALRESQSNLQTANETLEVRIAERTRELKAEAERHATTQTELALSMRLESIGQLAGGVAHDFNNLLAIIGGNLELATPHITHTESREFISKSLAAVNSCTSLNRRLLTFARKQNLKPITLSVGKQLLNIVSLLERTIGETIFITTKIDPTAWDAFIDPGELDSALINLSVNARDAMADGGQLTIEIRNVVLGDEIAEMHPNAIPGEFIGLFVTDTGIGMSEDVVQKVIEPFYTTKDKGTGLGLSSVYGFAQQSGGFLTIDSREGVGTTIRVFLPRATKQRDPLTAGTTKRTTPEAGGELILVVEDNPLVRELAVRRLKNLGYQVLDTNGGHEAVDILKNNLGIKLVFSDIVMPGGMTGHALAHWLAKNRPDVRILLTSGYNDPDISSTNQALNDGIEILEKPYPMDKLARRIRQTLDA